MVITTDDHVVRPMKQRALAKAVRAKVFEITCRSRRDDRGRPTVRGAHREAVDFVADAGADAASARRLA